MKAKLLTMLIQALVSMLNPALLKQLADMVLDFAENFVLGTKSELDDALVLPLTNAIREAFNIPDND